MRLILRILQWNYRKRSITILPFVNDDFIFYVEKTLQDNVLRTHPCRVNLNLVHRTLKNFSTTAMKPIWQPISILNAQRRTWKQNKKMQVLHIMKNSLLAPGNMDDNFKSKSMVIGKPHEEKLNPLHFVGIHLLQN